MPYNDHIPDLPAPLGAPLPSPPAPAKSPKCIAPGVFEGLDGKFYTEFPICPWCERRDAAIFQHYDDTKTCARGLS